MIKLTNVNNFKKGDKIFVRDKTTMWDSNKDEYYNYCFEYVIEVKRNNPKTFGCIYISGPHKGSGFNWHKGHNLAQDDKKEYYLMESDEEIIDNHYRI